MKRSVSKGAGIAGLLFVLHRVGTWILGIALGLTLVRFFFRRQEIYFLVT